MTQEAVADAAGLSRNTVYYAERGEVLPGLDTLDALAEALDVDLGNLVSARKRKRG